MSSATTEKPKLMPTDWAPRRPGRRIAAWDIAERNPGRWVRIGKGPRVPLASLNRENSRRAAEEKTGRFRTAMTDGYQYLVLEKGRS